MTDAGSILTAVAACSAVTSGGCYLAASADGVKAGLSKAGGFVGKIGDQLRHAFGEPAPADPLADELLLTLHRKTGGEDATDACPPSGMPCGCGDGCGHGLRLDVGGNGPAA